MSYEPPPQRPAFNPPPDPGYAAADYDQRQAGQPWAQQPYAQQQPPYYPPPQQQFYSHTYILPATAVAKEEATLGT